MLNKNVQKHKVGLYIQYKVIIFVLIFFHWLVVEYIIAVFYRDTTSGINVFRFMG